MPIPEAKLLQVRTIVVHANCPDGMASAMILHDALPEAEIRFVHYGTELEELEAKEGMLFCDIAPTKERAKDFLAKGALVLDHHKTAKDVVAFFAGLGDGAFGDEETEPGVSGAVLAYREVWMGAYSEDGLIVRRFAELAGIRDTWQNKHRDWYKACEQAEALRFWPQSHLLEAEVHQWPALLEIGPVLLEKRAEEVKRVVQGAYRFEGGAVHRRWVIVPTLATSDVMEALKGVVDGVAGFGFKCVKKGVVGGVEGFKDMPELIVSLRSRGDLDVSLIAKKHGGGGHTHAAGFQVDGRVAPYEFIETALAFAEALRPTGNGVEVMMVP